MELLQLSGVAERLTLAPHDDDHSDDGAYRERCDLRLACEPAAPSRARARLRHAVGEHLPSAALDAAILLTSELVTNAVIHPEHADDDVVTLAITTYEDRLRVEVSDSGSGFDPATPRPAHETGGRGLFLVDALANRWGTRRSDPGQRFTVWFELDAAGDPADAVAAGAS
jgi:anti-sigma regulatory factor (Ser/Thr protein kinase)